MSLSKGNVNVSATQPYGTATLKVPPAWDPRLEKCGYPFRIWLLDLAIWCNGCEVPDERMGAAVAERRGGVSQFLDRHISPENLRQNANIPNAG